MPQIPSPWRNHFASKELSGFTWWIWTAPAREHRGILMWLAGSWSRQSWPSSMEEVSGPWMPSSERWQVVSAR